MFIAVNFQAVCYLIQKSGHSITLSSNFLSEEEKQEKETSSDDDVNSKFLEFIHTIKENSSSINNNFPYRKDSKLKFVTANYSGAVYSPPDASLF